METFYSLGVVAENLVAYKLYQSGFKILAKNYRGRGFELDLIALRDQLLMLVEVKLRTCRKEQLDLQALIDVRKKNCLKKGLSAFISNHPVDFKTIRCDLALACLELKQEYKKAPKVHPHAQGIRLFYYQDINLG